MGPRSPPPAPASLGTGPNPWEGWREGSPYQNLPWRSLCHWGCSFSQVPPGSSSQPIVFSKAGQPGDAGERGDPPSALAGGPSSVMVLGDVVGWGVSLTIRCKGLFSAQPCADHQGWNTGPWERVALTPALPSAVTQFPPPVGPSGGSTAQGREASLMNQCHDSDHKAEKIRYDSTCNTSQRLD